ncbi:hypothetical protein BH10BAC5_BH10BAC5_28580 [soil metagenome]
MSTKNFFKNIFDLYSSDLNSSEFEKLFNKDLPFLYKFYTRDVEKPTHNSSNDLKSVLRFIKNVTFAFLRKLSGIRRLLFTFSIFIFIIGMLSDSKDMSILAFILLALLFFMEVADKLIAKNDLEVAREVQSGFIPVSSPESKVFDIACHSESAQEVGGDFIDFIENEDSLRIYIGDISGKGIAAALYMIHVNAILRHLTVKESSLSEIASGLNKDLIANFKKGVYLTLNMVEIKNNSSEDTIELIRAGHMPFLHFKKTTQELIEIEQKGSGIGLFSADMFEKNLESRTVILESNDILVLYTDGLTESMNPFKSEYGLERLRKIILQYNAYDPEGLKNEILKDITSFRNNESIHDDISLIILKKK